MIECKPCPLCGCSVTENRMIEECVISCDTCNLHLSEFNDGPDGPCISAVTRWNDRTSHLTSVTPEYANYAEIERLKSLLGRYADHVGAEEGTDFLNGVWAESPITDAEAKEISSYSPNLRAISHK